MQEARMIVKNEDLKSKLVNTTEAQESNESTMDINEILRDIALMSRIYTSKDIPIDIDAITRDAKTVIDALKNKEILEVFPKNCLYSFHLRELSVRESFPIVTKEWITPLAKWIGNRKCLEIMAGKGVISSALKGENVDIIATDNYSWRNFNFTDMWCDVENIDAIEAIEKYGANVDIVIMSWCYMDDTGYNALLKLREVNPNAMMIYIGEGMGGCTGSDALYETMEEIQDEDFEQIYSKFFSWNGIHDRLYLIK